MNDEENAALVIKTGVEQLFVPLHRLLDQLLGPAATEIGLTLGDSRKVWRFKRQIRLLQEVKRLVEDSGKDIKPIATRLFFPVLDAASIEDDDEMQTRWAALLANEATVPGSVHPSYIDILKQLAPGDARLLHLICNWCERYNERRLTTTDETREQDRDMISLLNLNQDSLENLVRLGLVQTEYGENYLNRDVHPVYGGGGRYLDSWYELSDFAVRFVHACRAPTQEQK